MTVKSDGTAWNYYQHLQTQSYLLKYFFDLKKRGSFNARRKQAIFPYFCTHGLTYGSIYCTGLFSIDELFSEEQKLVRDTVRAYVKEISPIIEDYAPARSISGTYSKAIRAIWDALVPLFLPNMAAADLITPATD